MQLQGLVRHQLSKNESELEESPLKKKSIIEPFYFLSTDFYLILFLFGLHGATFIFTLEVLDIAQGLTSAAFVQIFPCIILFPIVLANRNLDHVNMLSK